MITARRSSSWKNGLKIDGAEGRPAAMKRYRVWLRNGMTFVRDVESYIELLRWLDRRGYFVKRIERRSLSA